MQVGYTLKIIVLSCLLLPAVSINVVLLLFTDQYWLQYLKVLCSSIVCYAVLNCSVQHWLSRCVLVSFNPAVNFLSRYEAVIFWKL